MNWLQYQGVPYKTDGRDPAEGLDCFGLVSLLIPGVPEYEDLTEEVRANWKAVDKPEPVDVVVMIRPDRTRHIGVYLESGLVVHASEKHGVIGERLAVLRQRYRQVKFYRKK